VKNWPLVEEAIDAKIEDQIEFVVWWNEKVRAAHRPGTNSDHALVTREDAENQAGVTQPQVSRWRKHLGMNRPDDCSHGWNIPI
jgi:hypothetical protein